MISRSKQLQTEPITSGTATCIALLGTITMSTSKLSVKDRLANKARSLENKISSVFKPSRSLPPLIQAGLDPTSDTAITGASRTVLAGTSIPLNRPSLQVPTTVARTETSTIFQDTTPAVARQLGPVGESGPISEIPSLHVSSPVADVSPRPKTPSSHVSSPDAHHSISLFQGAQNVYMYQPTITMANNLYNVFGADGNEHQRSKNILSEKLLPRARFAEFDAASPAPRNACTENTRTAILDTLRAWAADKSTTKIYWLNGMAGTGKTTIAYSFSEFLDEEQLLGGTFFCSHLRLDTSDVRCIIPTLCLQLARYLPRISHLISDVVEANPDCSSWRIGKQFLNFMVKPLTTASGDSREVTPVIVLDALDECSDQSLVAELLSVISKHSKSLPVKFFVTSRPEVLLKQTFDKFQTHSNFILHEVEKEIVKADIELYIRACLMVDQVKDHGHFDDWPPQAELEKLVNLSGTLFIYAATVCKYIAQRGSWSMSDRLLDVVNAGLETTSGATHPLDILYERILDAAYALTNVRERSDIGMVLEVVVYVYNPLSMTGISALLQIPIRRVYSALSPLHSLIYIPSSGQPEDPISMFHASFQDFISNKAQSSKYYLDFYTSHEHLALQCLSLMDREWSQQRTISYLAERNVGEVSEALAYACTSWAFHFTDADTKNCYDELHLFFKRHLLQWMDCLSILGQLGTAMYSLHKLEKWSNIHKVLVTTIIDARKFLAESFDFIKNNSLEGCPSALAWLPEKSYIWKTYGIKSDCIWKLCWGRRKTWSLCETVLREHSTHVRSAMFSPDSMHIVTVAGDVAQIWNTVTGECEAKLEGHSDSINSAVFSPDGMLVVSASIDHTIRIWNTTTGQCEADLIGHSDRVTSASFSPDGMYIVSACQDHAWVWNTATRECKAKLLGHLGQVNSVVFSPDSMHIVSGSDDFTACIWSTTTGTCEAELKGHSGWILSAVFSPDSMQIVSASADNTAQIWDTTTGKSKAVLRGHSGMINSAVFSLDSMHIVSASADCTARVWNTATGECEAELKGHLKQVHSAIFSPDGTHIVTASNDSTIWIWNVITTECEAELKEHSNFIYSVVFSPDGRYILSASADHTARIWNAVIEGFEPELKDHLDQINSVAFSPDGMHVLSASADHTARIWNTATGECEAELNGHLNELNSAVFSSDGMFIVSASSDCTARIWDTVTGKCKVELKGHSNQIYTAVFSSDDMHVVSVSADYTVCLWDAATGNCKVELKEKSKQFYIADLSPDGMHIVTASFDHTAQIWSTTTGEYEAEIKGHSTFINSVIFSSDSMHIVTASSNNTICIWDTATAECKGELQAELSPLGSILLSFSGTSLSTPSLPDGAFIHHNFDGNIYVSSSPYTLGKYKNWIVHQDSLQKLWVPSTLSNPTSLASHMSKICLGYPTGEILLIDFLP